MTAHRAIALPTEEATTVYGQAISGTHTTTLTEGSDVPVTTVAPVAASDPICTVSFTQIEHFLSGTMVIGGCVDAEKPESLTV
ncbi:hypothetical protein TWF730_002977 [Orbilia blumenaviensis]|uniref:Uncharacterized protein n=1 Tax=Orbilia blumenaviensis TaxID=1796055 RepID=A0AAV9UAM0_9PEZI